MSEVGHLLLDRLRVALEGEIRKLDPALPTVLLAHLMADSANLWRRAISSCGQRVHHSALSDHARLF